MMMNGGYDRPSPQNHPGQNQLQMTGELSGQPQLAENQGLNGNGGGKRKSRASSPAQTPTRIAPSPKLGGRRGAIASMDEEGNSGPNKRSRD